MVSIYIAPLLSQCLRFNLCLDALDCLLTTFVRDSNHSGEYLQRHIGVVSVSVGGFSLSVHAQAHAGVWTPSLVHAEVYVSSRKALIRMIR